jgi:hypothetical protein
MKFEIDLNDILSDEFGAETLQESIKRQVVDNITKKISEGVLKRIDNEVNMQITSIINEAIADKMPAIVDDIMNCEYSPVDRYGTRKDKTTFRKELVNTIAAECVYKNTSYNSDKNTFTKAVDNVVTEQMKLIEQNYKKEVDEAIGKKAFDLAIDTLKKKLGL